MCMVGCEVQATTYIWKSEDNPMGNLTPVRVPRSKLGLSAWLNKHLYLQSYPTGPSSGRSKCVRLHEIPSEPPHCTDLPEFTVLFRLLPSTWQLL